MTFRNKMSDGEGISVSITASKALVGHIKEWVMLLLLDNVADLLPLLLCGINAGRIMGACVQKYETSFRCSLEICYHTLEI